MTKPKPLKNKYCMAEILFGKTLVFQKEDVKSAVEWLKQEIFHNDYSEQAILKTINKAFQDVIE